MKSGRTRWFIALALYFAFTPAMVRAAVKPVMVHYMPWFVGKPYSASWGYHWTMNFYNPDNTNAAGNRLIASQYYPLIGPYDSLDPAVLEYHVLLMKLGGVDGVIADWYGQETYNDYGLVNTRTTALFNWTRKAGLKFSVCFEDRSVQAKVSGGYITAGNATTNAQASMLYLQTNYFNDASYLRLNNKPLLLSFGNPPVYFTTGAQWTNIFSVLNATNQPAFFGEDSRLSPAAVGAYSWPPVFGGNTISTSQLNSYLNNFNIAGNSWPAFISSAFPRYYDIYGQAGGTSNGYLDDASGSTFTNTLRRAMTNNAALVQVATWNDFGEGTIVEPTKELGFRDLGIIQGFRRQYMDTNFSYTTNDLAVALRFYNLRKQYGNYPTLAAELDRAFTNIISGKVATASLQLTGIESNTPVIYNLSVTSNQMQFSIGGFVLGGAQVRMSTNLSTWQTVKTFSASTSLLTFSTNFVQPVRSFFKVQ